MVNQKLRQYNIKNRYGKSLSFIQKMEAVHNSSCWICFRKAPLQIDEDHSKPKHHNFRGMVCGECNLGLKWMDKYSFSIQLYLTNMYRD